MSALYFLTLYLSFSQSWFIGKVSNPSAPKEGSTSVNLTPEETAAQVSPLSSAFPLGNGKV
jgi:hypothetical protein